MEPSTKKRAGKPRTTTPKKSKLPTGQANAIRGKQYVLHFITKPSLKTEEVFALREGVNEKITEAGGQIGASLCKELADALAYPIKKETRGFFCETIFTIPAKDIGTFANSLKRDEQILRYMIERKEIRERKRLLKRRVRKPSATVPQGAPSQPQEILLAPISHEQEKREKISMEEIDKKLDEIIKNI